MLKAISILAAVSLSVLVLGLSIARTRWVPELAGGLEVMAAEESESDYVMPYPGVLPDSPLYIVKMIRDKVREILTVAAEDKVVLFNLYADKRVGAMEVLMKSGKVDLAIDTGNKGAAYQQKALAALEAVKARGGDVGKGGNVLERAILKHIEIVSNLQETNQEAPLSGMLEQMEKNYASVKATLGR